jgi:hypothetical protein
MKTQHHPSCKTSDRDLVWLCAQCGTRESAGEIEAQRDELLAALKALVTVGGNKNYSFGAVSHQAASAIAKAEGQ